MKKGVPPNRGNNNFHKEKEPSGAHPSPFILIFTDLDGTLLDHDSWLIRSSRLYPDLQGVIPHLKVTQEPGSKGWNAAVLDILRHEIPMGV